MVGATGLVRRNGLRLVTKVEDCGLQKQPMRDR